MDVYQDQEELKPYASPEIIHELDLEIRAGSPLGVEDFEGQPLIP